MRHGDIQFEFPSYRPPEPPTWLIWFAEHILKPLGWLLSHPIVKYLFWAGIAAALGLIFYLVVTSIIRRGWFSGPDAQASSDERRMEAWRPTQEKARLLLADADALAATGKFAEAIHLILLRSVADIGERRPDILKPALTSREIGGLRGLPEEARRAFVAIARVVERAIFAGLDVGAAEYAQCRAEYERFAFPDTWLLGKAA